MKQMRIILAGMRLLLLKKIHICQLKKSLKGMRIKKMITLLRSKNRRKNSNALIITLFLSYFD